MQFPVMSSVPLDCLCIHNRTTFTGSNVLDLFPLFFNYWSLFILSVFNIFSTYLWWDKNYCVVWINISSGWTSVLTYVVLVIDQIK